ncbi:MAG: GGDEF domain-containing protein [Spirochaetes bacterium]|jgi:diguanylate cyclase (GGDEF)-like protein|nr:GGDEF domain-containing protein [Spirochaetota bacterium]
MQNSAEFLGQIEIFSLLETDEISKIIKYFKKHDISENEVLFNEGDQGNDLYIVKSGIISSKVKLPDGGERDIANFEAGNFFGEMSIFEKAPRSATCYCRDRCTIFSLHDKNFYEIVEKYPDIAIKIMYRMLNITTRRLRSTGEFLSDMVTWGESASRRAITDEMTGAYNRRYLDDAIVSQFENARSSGTPLSIIMIDLDYFRQINETYGHPAGDRMIMEVVKIYNKILRKKDILARYGGDEFTILMPGTDLKTAAGIAENVRVEVEKLDILLQYNGPIKKVTLSQGVSSFPENADNLKKLRELADQSLYTAKEQGRNRVVCAK